MPLSASSSTSASSFSLDLVVLVLNADDLRNHLCLGDLRRSHVGQTDVADEAPVLKFGKCSDLLFDRSLSGAVNVARYSQVDHVERVQPKVAKVVENTNLDIIRLERWYPRAVFTADSANLGDDQKVIRGRME